MVRNLVVRAKNEQERIAGVVTAAQQEGFRVTVLLSGTTDGTGVIAASLDAATRRVPNGVGAATKEAIRLFRDEPFLLLDGDLYDIPRPALHDLWHGAARGIVSKGIFDTPGRASRLLHDESQRLGVELPGDVPPWGLVSAYSGYPAGLADSIDLACVPDERGADLAISLLAHRAGHRFLGVPVGSRRHADRGDAHIATLIAANTVILEAFA